MAARNWLPFCTLKLYSAYIIVAPLDNRYTLNQIAENVSIPRKTIMISQKK